LNPTIAVVNQSLTDLTRVQGLLQRIEHQVRLHRSTHTPAHNAAGEHVDHEGDVDESRPGGHVGEVGDPQLVGSRGYELPLHAIQRPFSDVRRNGRALLAPTHHAAEACAAHQPLNRAACHRNAFAAQLPPDLACTIDPEVLVPDPVNRAGKLRIALHARRQSRWIGLPALVFVIRRWGDRQLLADRLDPILAPMRVDEREHHFPRRSSSAWAKNAEALRRISLARFSSAFSRSSCLTRSRSASAVLRRGSAVASAFITHDLSVSDVQPIFSAIDRIASHRVGYSWTCSWNSRTARSRTSVGYLFDVFPMAPFFQVMEPPGNPGRFSTH